MTINKKITINKNKKSLVMVCLSLFCSLIFDLHAASHQHQQTAKTTNEIADCHLKIECAQTVTSAFAPNGDLWRLWAIEKSIFIQISIDKGVTFLPAKKISNINEAVSARNENRPKIAFDNYQGVYLSWSSPKQKRFTSDVRFSYSKDYGKKFTQAVTVNDDNLITGHSFNEMQVSGDGKISIVWLDGRVSYQLKKEGKPTNGSALFLASANFRKGKMNFENHQLALGTCVCCRLSTDVDINNNLAIFWRHIYGDNIREFALMTLNENKSPIRISNDHWYIDGCPHQGGAISIGLDNLYHLVWYNQGDSGKGIFYSNSNNAGHTLNPPRSIGNVNNHAAHPNILVNNQQLDIVWMEFNGTTHQLWHQQSNNGGKSFNSAKILATTNNGADRPFIIKYKNQSYVSWQRYQNTHWLQKI